MEASLPFKSPYILGPLNCIFCDYEASRKQFKQGLLKLGGLLGVNKNYTDVLKKTTTFKN